MNHSTGHASTTHSKDSMRNKAMIKSSTWKQKQRVGERSVLQICTAIINLCLGIKNLWRKMKEIRGLFFFTSKSRRSFHSLSLQVFENYCYRVAFSQTVAKISGGISVSTDLKECWVVRILFKLSSDSIFLINLLTIILIGI